MAVTYIHITGNDHDGYYYAAKINGRVVGASVLFDTYEKCYIAAKDRSIKSRAELIVEKEYAKKKNNVQIIS